MKKNVSGQKIGAQLVSATDGSAFTGSVTVHVTGDAGTQAAGSVGSGACTHEGNGYHTYAPAQAETNYDLVAFTFTGTGAVPATVQVFTSFPQTGDNYAELTSGTYGLSVIEGLVDDIGAAGAGLTAIPWNAAWDAEVQSECADALTAYDAATGTDVTTAAGSVTLANGVTHGGTGAALSLERLVITSADGVPNITLAGSGNADGIAFTRSGSGNPFDAEFAAQLQQEATDALNAYDPPTNTEMVAAFTQIKGATWATTDTLEAIRDKLTDVETDTNELQVAHAAGDLGANVDKINGVTITGDGNATPFDVV
jgi:hypothetical protein